MQIVVEKYRKHNVVAVVNSIHNNANKTLTNRFYEIHADYDISAFLNCLVRDVVEIPTK